MSAIVVRPSLLFRVLGASALLLAGVVAAILFVEKHPASPWRYPALIAPMAIIFISVVVTWLSMQGMDELARRIHFEAMAIAFLGSFTVISIYSFLLYTRIVPMTLSMFAPMMVVWWVIGVGVSIWRYR